MLREEKISGRKKGRQEERKKLFKRTNRTTPHYLNQQSWKYLLIYKLSIKHPKDNWNIKEHTDKKYIV